ncbi:hypothetical protein [Sphingomonas beigongshangi]|uniref:hypothetical protein n=1 Tax=Sphingomonas beigongshangi TaxID=2782540 RepID=UPI00193BD954|nr:hypothetical protein [Sphingomonas beigongshangi]
MRLLPITLLLLVATALPAAAQLQRYLYPSPTAPLTTDGLPPGTERFTVTTSDGLMLTGLRHAAQLGVRQYSSFTALRRARPPASHGSHRSCGRASRYYRPNIAAIRAIPANRTNPASPATATPFMLRHAPMRGIAAS